MNWETFVTTLLQVMGFEDYRVELDLEHRRGSIFIYSHTELVKENLASFLESLNQLLQLVAKAKQEQPVFFDINNYRKEREHLIAELARTAARKVVATKQHLQLPAMNSYERRIIHMELAAHPEVKTESVGTGKERSVVIQPVS